MDWISGFQSGFLDFRLDFWISDWISGFQIGFLPTVYEISFVADPSVSIATSWLIVPPVGVNSQFVVLLPPLRAYFFFWTHFRLSLWMTTHLRMRRTTPSVYLDL